MSKYAEVVATDFVNGKSRMGPLSRHPDVDGVPMCSCRAQGDTAVFLSYRTQVARIEDDWLMVTTRQYSVTTSDHLSEVVRAWQRKHPGRDSRVLWVDNIYRGYSDDNVLDRLVRATGYLRSAARPRIKADTRAREFGLFKAQLSRIKQLSQAPTFGTNAPTAQTMDWYTRLVAISCGTVEDALPPDGANPVGLGRDALLRMQALMALEGVKL